jgi:1-acyl-sn-glycerol-3-phosphate acyltransferase
MGCYKIDKDVLKTSEKFLKNKNSLCIFIEGKINNYEQIKPKVGALCIEREIKDSYIVPVKIKYSNHKLRKDADITFKQKFRHHLFPSDLQPLADKLLDKIRR